MNNDLSHTNQLNLQGIVLDEPQIIKGVYDMDYVKLVLGNNIYCQNKRTSEQMYTTYSHKVLFLGSQKLISEAGNIKPNSEIEIKAQVLTRMNNPYFENASTEIAAYDFWVTNRFNDPNHTNQLSLQGIVVDQPQIIRGAYNLNYVMLVLGNNIYYQNSRTLEQMYTTHWHKVLFLGSQKLIRKACNIKPNSEIKIKAQIVNSPINNSHFKSAATEIIAYAFESNVVDHYLKMELQ